MQHDVFIVTSNYTIKDIFGPKGGDSSEQIDAKREMVKAIEDRFQVQYLNEKPAVRKPNAAVG